jgi:hypothetical protein
MNNEADFLLEYYLQQQGSGWGTIYNGPIYQQGHGLGSFMAKLFRTIMPFIKSGAKKAGKEILKTGSHVIQDITEQNVPWKESLSKRSQEAIGRVTSGSGYNKRPTQGNSHSSIKRVRRNIAQKIIENQLKKNSKKKSKKKRARDIFD